MLSSFAFQLGSLAKWSAAIVAGVILASLTLKRSVVSGMTGKHANR